MPDSQPPEIGELFRLISQIKADQKDGFAEINKRLDRVVSVDVYEGNNRRVDERLKDLADDIAAEKVLRSEQLAWEKNARETDVRNVRKQMDKLTNNIRWITVSLVLPIGLFIANLVVSRGGTP